MKKHHILVTAAAIAALLCAPTFAQRTPAQAPCSGLMGAELNSCLRAAPSMSGEGASVEGNQTPATKEDAAARSYRDSSYTREQRRCNGLTGAAYDSCVESYPRKSAYSRWGTSSAFYSETFPGERYGEPKGGSDG